MSSVSEVVPEGLIIAHLKRKVKDFYKGQVLRLPVQLYRSWPDAVILLPGGKIGFLELKRTGAVPTEGQFHILQKLVNWGFKADWTDSKAGVDLFLEGL